MLRLPAESWNDPAAAKAAFRRLSLRWHPDKHSGEAAKERATGLFVRIAAAYHTLTTTNFDYARRVLQRRRRGATHAFCRAELVWPATVRNAGGVARSLCRHCRRWTTCLRWRCAAQTRRWLTLCCESAATTAHTRSSA